MGNIERDSEGIRHTGDWRHLLGELDEGFEMQKYAPMSIRNLARRDALDGCVWLRTKESLALKGLLPWWAERKKRTSEEASRSRLQRGFLVSCKLPIALAMFSTLSRRITAVRSSNTTQHSASCTLSHSALYIFLKLVSANKYSLACSRVLTLPLRTTNKPPQTLERFCAFLFGPS